MLELTGGEALLRSLLSENVRHVFGIAAGKLVNFMHAMANEPDIRYTGTRHEAAAAHMAAAVWASTGQIAVAMAEAGPGGANLVPGVASAFNNSLALLAITSNNQHFANYPGRGMFMELDTQSVFRPITKFTAVVHDGRRIPELVRRAFREALCGRPGPVHLDVPQDILASTFRFDMDEFSLPPAAYRCIEPIPPARHALEAAAALLESAKRPLIIAGGGVSAAQAAPQAQALAAAVNGAATSTQMGTGAIPTNHPNFVGHGGVIGGPALLRAFDEADVILAAGCRFSSWLWNERGAMVKRPQQLIHVDINPAAIGANAPVTVGICADAKVALTELLGLLRPERAQGSQEWLQGLVAEYRSYHQQVAGLATPAGATMHPAALAVAIAAHLPPDALVTYDGGHTTFWSNELTPALAPRTRFHDPGMAQLGFGLPYALALKLVHPGQPVFNITGDGAFGFMLQEMDTARRYHLPVVNIIHNNEAWGVIRSGQQRSKSFEFGVDLSGTDYAAIARGFGCHGERVTEPEQVKPALERALASGLPAVLDCRVVFEPHPCMPAFGKMGAAGGLTRPGNE
jgi:acetolactate synthase-1/2/3 large subunit